MLWREKRNERALKSALVVDWWLRQQKETTTRQVASSMTVTYKRGLPAPSGASSVAKSLFFKEEAFARHLGNLSDTESASLLFGIVMESKSI